MKSGGATRAMRANCTEWKDIVCTKFEGASRAACPAARGHPCVRRAGAGRRVLRLCRQYLQLDELRRGSDSYIVTFSAGTSDAAARALLASVDATVDSHIAPLRMYSVTLPSAPPPRRSRPTPASPASTPTRSAASRRSRTTRATPTSGRSPRIGWEAARDAVTRPARRPSPILDTGVDASHPDLDGNLVAGTSILDGGARRPTRTDTARRWRASSPPRPTTARASPASAMPASRSCPSRSSAPTAPARTRDIIEGVVWAADHGADVILMSFSNPGYSESLQAAIDYAWSQNVVLVAATGNGGSSEPTFPAGDRGVIGVSSTGLTDALSSTLELWPRHLPRRARRGRPRDDRRRRLRRGHRHLCLGRDRRGRGRAPARLVGRRLERRHRLAARAERRAGRHGEQTGNGRLNLDRAIVDTSSDSVQPAGAAPVGGGGPFVGPYTIAAAASSTAPR